MSSIFRHALCASLMAAFPACVVSTSGPAPSQSNGTLLLRWTIQGQSDPNQCNATASASIQINVTGPSGGVFSQVCNAFSTSISLARGDYRASAALVDASGRPRTTYVDIHPFTIYGNDTVDIPIDFPANSFH
jgi:hypothetical protein